MGMKIVEEIVKRTYADNGYWLPLSEVQPLVRCKDCRHGGCRTTYTDGRLAKVVCKLHGTKKNEVWMDADWFCADGELAEQNVTK